MATVNIDGQTIFYTQQNGRFDRPTLLLLHGAGGRHSDWPGKLRHLGETAVYTPDFPGHAQSDGAGYDTIGGYADFVLAFIRALQLHNVVVVGHSMGGAIAQTLALRQTPEVIGLVLVGTSARLRVGDPILHNILPDFNKAVGIIIKYAWSRYAQPIQVGLAKRMLAETRPEVLYGDFFACNQFDVRGQLNQIGVPTLVISGAEDQMTPAKHGQALAAEIPNARYVEIPKTGHFVMLEKPDPVAKAVADFVAQTAWKMS